MRDPDRLIERAEIRPDTTRDQHFLVDDRVLDRIPGYLEPGEDDHLLEVGAGTGALTERLLNRGDHVTAIEQDPDLVDFLRSEFAAPVAADRLTVVQGDALTVDLPRFDASVSNLPYGVASEVLFRLLPLGRPLVATVQAEFAERMVADPGRSAYGRLSVSARHFADVTVVESVPREAFTPQPRVESAVIRAEPRDPPYEVPDEDFFLRFVKAVFTQRRKTMRNAVRNTAHISGIAAPDRVVGAAAEDLMARRPADLSPTEFAELANIAADVGGIDPEGRP